MVRRGCEALPEGWEALVGSQMVGKPSKYVRRPSQRAG